MSEEKEKLEKAMMEKFDGLDCRPDFAASSAIKAVPKHVQERIKARGGRSRFLRR